MEVEGDNITWFTFTGEEEVPNDATHVFVRTRVVPGLTFMRHPNIVEVVCHEDVQQIEVEAFYHCPCLKRVIMPGVLIVEDGAFNFCEALMYVECGNLYFIRTEAFSSCTSLRSIDLTSVVFVDRYAFPYCEDLTDVKFSSKLETLGGNAFHECTNLERITIPLKDGLIDNDVFKYCEKLKQVDLVEGAINETIAALHLEEWRNDMNDEINSINQILPQVLDDFERDEDEGGKTSAIREWIGSVIRKITRYKAQHQLLLDEAATTLQLALPHDIMTNDVLTFLALPSHSFDLEESEEEEEESDESNEEEWEE